MPARSPKWPKEAGGPSASTQWSGLATDIFVYNIDEIARAAREGRAAADLRDGAPQGRRGDLRHL